VLYDKNDRSSTFCHFVGYFNHANEWQAIPAKKASSLTIRFLSAEMEQIDFRNAEINSFLKGYGFIALPNNKVM